MIKFWPPKTFLYQLYIFQLEEYQSARFFRALFRKGLFPPHSLRKKVKWTQKTAVLLVLSLTQQVILTLIIVYFLSQAIENTLALFLIGLFFFYLLTILAFVFLAQSADILKPFEYLIKWWIIHKAKEKMKHYRGKVIGITGSYGKTTMKETLATVLAEKFKVVKTEGNNNTPLGIARTILKKLTHDTDIMVVEMGEYVKGDVKALCAITKPDISVITGINEAHLERYMTMENAISTKFEIVENAKENAFILLNGDDELVMQNFEHYVGDHDFYFYHSKDAANLKINNYNFNQTDASQTFELVIDNITTGRLKTPIAAKYIIGNIVAAFAVGRYLGIKDSEIRIGVSKLKNVDHRLQPLHKQSGILIIDDTYNGNSEGIKQGLNLLANFTQRRKVYVTPGLVETGTLSKELHLQIGKDISNVADVVVLIKNSVTGFIYDGLIQEGFDDKKIIWFENSKIAYEQLATLLKPNDVVLMQNDWSDNYS